MRLPPDFSYDLLDASLLAAAVSGGLGVLSAGLHFFGAGRVARLGALVSRGAILTFVAGFAGAFIPVLLERVGVDPAVGSSIFVTTFTDTCGFLLLLGMAAWLLL